MYFYVGVLVYREFVGTSYFLRIRDHGIHHHHSPPFGRIVLELFPSIEYANLSRDYKGYPKMDGL